ncbi:TMV resistance protein N, partial [Mucuna pruriens]
MAMQPCSSSFSYRFSYDVFLSFRGKDTRYGFTGNLYKALLDRGIRTFIDHKELQKGDLITSALEKAIQDSRIFIIVLSQNYASSSFCLNELAYILNFTNQKGLLVFLIFHNVNPSDVRNHTGSFREALAGHKNKFKANLDKLETWK